MKTAEELEKIRESMKDRINQGKDRKRPRITVGMATCGIAAGARPVYDAIVDELQIQGITDIDVVQTGCIGVCKLEPLVEVTMPGEEKVTYVKMTASTSRRMIREHVIKGRVIDELTMHVVEGKVLNDFVVMHD
jgi:(2Fe-2S) ferredoxin